MIEVVVVRGEGDEILSALKAEWKDLFLTARCSPFLSWEWMSVWFESFGENRTPFILKAYRGEELVAILPMFIEGSKFLGIPYTTLSLMGLGPGGADYLGPIVKPGEMDAAVGAFLDFIKKNIPGDLICLENLDRDSCFARMAKTVASADTDHWQHNELVESECAQIDLSRGWEYVLGQSKRKSNFKRRFRKLEVMDGFEFRSVTEPSKLGAAFERFLILHDKRWQGAGGSELSGHPRLISFQRKLIHALSGCGLFRFDELWVDGECRSSVYALEHGGTFYYYNSGYDVEYADLSVGLVLIGLSIQNAIRRGNTRYDFLRGEEAYKFDWANRSTDLVSIRLRSRMFPVIAQDWSRATAKAFIGLSKSVLPDGVSGTLGNWRRSLKRSYLLSGK